MSKYQVDVPGGQVGVIGDGAQIGEMHFHAPLPSIPLQRPPRAEHFTDRERELAQLLADLQPGKVVTLCGPGGIGKTVLAAEVVWALAPGDEPPERFPDGVVFHSFYGRPDVALAFEHIVRSFDETARDTSAEAARRALSNKQALLLLDGTEAADDLGAVLGVRGGCGVLVTSRARRDAVAERQDVQPLESEEALALLQAWGKGQAADEAVGKSICQQVGRLPLAVRLVGRYLDQTEEPAAEYLEWLKETPIEALSHGEHREESVDLLLARSLEQVSQGAREVLAVVGLLALAPFGVEPLAQALELAARGAKRLLGELVSYGLLLRGGERYEVSHALVHTYARERLAIPEEAAERLAAYYTQLAEAESEKGLEGYRRLDAERAHIMQVLRACAERRQWKTARSLVWAVGGHRGYLAVQGHWTEWVQVSEVGIKAARISVSRYDEGAFLIHLGLAYDQLGQYQRAIESYEAAVAIACETGNKQMRGAALNNFGLACYSLGQFRQAIRFYEQALDIYREICAASPERSVVWAAMRRAEGGCLGNLGNIHDSLGEHQRAIEYHKQALSIRREISDQQGEGNDLGNLAISYKNLGQYQQAIKFSQQALDISREIGDRQNEAAQLSNLGAAHCFLGQHQQAIEFYEQALAISQEIGHRRGEGSLLGNLAVAHYSVGQYQQAIEFCQRALSVSQEIGDRRNEGKWLGNLGSIHAALGDVEKAVEHYQQARTIAREIGDRRAEAFACWNLGLLHEESDPARAVELMSVRVAYEREIGHPDAKADAEQVAQIKARTEQGGSANG